MHRYMHNIGFFVVVCAKQVGGMSCLVFMIHFYVYLFNLTETYLSHTVNSQLPKSNLHKMNAGLSRRCYVSLFFLFSIVLTLH